MKYYKRIMVNSSPYQIGIIYKEDYAPDLYLSVKASIKCNKNIWEEVTEREYWEQELNSNRLVVGAYYVNSISVIHKHSGTENAEYYLNYSQNTFKRNAGNFDIVPMFNFYTLATDEEIEWLEACNKADKFITKKEFMESKLNKKPYKNLYDITYEMLTNHSYFKTLTKGELADIINYCTEELYAKLPGYMSEDKAKQLINKWNSEIQFVLPVKWGVKVNSFNLNELEKWVQSKEDLDDTFKDLPKSCWVLSDKYNDNSYQKWGQKIPYNYTEITFDQFKKYVLKEDMKQEKELVGYKLIKPEMEKAVKAICTDFVFWEKGDINLNIKQDISIKNLEKAGVLYLWFEPVYKDPVKKGDWVVVTEQYRNNSPKLGEVCKLVNIDTTVNVPYLVEDTNNVYNWKYKNRQWCCDVRKATPEEIEEATKPKFPAVSIKGYRAELEGDTVNFGCQSYDKNFVLQLGKFLEKSELAIENRGEIMKVVKYFKNN